MESVVTAADIKVIAADTEVVAIDTNQKKGIKGICLYKQETHIENSSRTIITPPSTLLKTEADLF